jgi:hypothetical protein
MAENDETGKKVGINGGPIGYKNPPADGLIPGIGPGRPKGRRNFKTILEELAQYEAPAKMVEALRKNMPNLPEKTTIDTAIAARAVLDALAGDSRAREQYLERTEGKVPDRIMAVPPEESPLTDEDKANLADALGL